MEYIIKNMRLEFCLLKYSAAFTTMLPSPPVPDISTVYNRYNSTAVGGGDATGAEFSKVVIRARIFKRAQESVPMNQFRQAV
jgi:hypothetical protein